MRGEAPGAYTLPLSRIAPGQAAIIPPPRHDLGLDVPRLTRIVRWQPGVTRGDLPNGFAVVVDRPTPVQIEREGVSFSGRKGAVIVDRKAATVRIIMLEGDRAGYRQTQAWAYAQSGLMTSPCTRIGSPEKAQAAGGCSTSPCPPACIGTSRWW